MNIIIIIVVFAIIMLTWYYYRLKSINILKKLQAKLQKSENLYQAIVEDQTELICRFLPDGTLTFVNEAYCRYFNKQKKQLIGYNFFPLIPQEDRTVIHQNIANLNKKNPIFTHEHRVINPWGQIRWHQWTNRAFFNDKDELIEFQAVGRDITLLKEIEHKLIKLNNELEDRVKQRTEQLEKEIEERKLIENVLRNTKDQYQKLVEGLPAIIYSFSSQKGGIYYSPFVTNVLGYTPEYLYQNPFLWQNSIHPEDLSTVLQVIQELGQNPNFEIEYRLKDVQGNWHWLYDRSISKKLDNNEIIIEGLAIDITERKKLEQEVTESKDRFQKAIINAPFPIIIHAEDGQVIQINQVWTEITGYTQEEIPTINDLVEKCYRDNKHELRLIVNKLYDLTEKVDNGEFNIYTKTGDIRIWNFSSAPLGTLPDQRRLVISTAVDITERKQAENQLIYDGFHDSLTGLYNRNLFKERVEQCIKLTKREPDYLFAVLFIDIDRFKIINDSLGHQIGDYLLIEIAKRLEKSVRSSDTLARLGGDEFTILLDPIKNIKEATVIAERINYELSLPFYLEQQQITTSASIGIAFSSTGYEQWSDLLRDADLAMYGAKEKGKDRYEIFDPLMHIQIRRFLELETDLRLGLERKEFVLYYQPIFDLKTQKLAGFEALVRWQHPKQGLLSPYEFIPIAEETGLIIALGEWIILEACLQMKLWQLKYPSTQNLKVSVNLSGKQLQQKNLVENIDQILHKVQLEPDNLKVEITESILIENQVKAHQILKEIRKRNITISLDDFGTGYSSLSYLHRFPIDTLKVDKSFVNRISETGQNLAIVEAIINLAHTLKMDVIAEGIETNFHLEKLTLINCEYGQGYLFSRPLPPAEIEKFFHSD